MLTGKYKEKRMKFVNWTRIYLRRDNRVKILFADKMFNIDEVYKSQNDRIWAANRSVADTKDDIRQEYKFLQKIMLWLGVCSKGVSPLAIFDDGTVDHYRYVEAVLPVALKFGNDMLGTDWIFQKDGGKPHIDAKSQE